MSLIEYNKPRYLELGRFYLYWTPLLMIWGIFSIPILCLQMFELWILLTICFLGFGVIFGVTMRVFYEFSYNIFEIERISTKFEIRKFKIMQEDGTIKEHKAFVKRDKVMNDIYYRFLLDSFNNDLSNIET